MIISQKAKEEHQNNIDRIFITQNNNKCLGRKKDLEVFIFIGHKDLLEYDLSSTRGVKRLVLNESELQLILNKYKSNKSKMKNANTCVEAHCLERVKKSRRWWFNIK